MRLLIILTALIVHTLAATIGNDKSGDTLISKSDKQKADEIEAIPTSYDFKYSTGSEGPAQLFREEHRDHDGSVRGKYGYVDPNGKLRVVEYRAGANGYTVTGDIGPDKATQSAAQYEQRNDPSVRTQADVWNRVQGSSGGSGVGSSLGSGGWSGVDPLWNVSPQQSPQQQQQQPLATKHQFQSPAVSGTGDKLWDDKTQSAWDTSSGNNWRSDDRSDGDSGRSGGVRSPVDWNTWSSGQNSWTKQQQIGSTSGNGQSWTSRVQHDWPNSPTSTQPQQSAGAQWGQQSNQLPPQSTPVTSKWTPPSSPTQGSSTGQWLQQPSSGGQWGQFGDNNAVSGDQGSTVDTGIHQQSPKLPATQRDVTELRQKWTGIPPPGKWQDPITPGSQPTWNSPISSTGNIAPQQQQQQWGQQSTSAQWQPSPSAGLPQNSIADQWAQRAQQQQQPDYSGVQWTPQQNPGSIADQWTQRQSNQRHQWGQTGQQQWGQRDQPQLGQTSRPQWGQTSQPQLGQSGQSQWGQSGQPQLGQSGQPQLGQSGQPQLGQLGQTQWGLSGQPQWGQSGQPQWGQSGQPQLGQTGNPQWGQSGQQKWGETGQQQPQTQWTQTSILGSNFTEKSPKQDSWLNTAQNANAQQSQPQPQWPQSPAKTARLADLAQSGPTSLPDQQQSPPKPLPVPYQPSSAIGLPQPSAQQWSQPIGTNVPSGQGFSSASLSPPSAQRQQSQQQWPTSGQSGSDMFGGAPFVQFMIEHTIDPNQPPLKYQYSY
ncbi:uncharacterized protein LOC128951860 [Oppia nitens]|uniref:uncharacterized protein LOC128951860 n=1 Tax=Oppia nitens TaxID=1686743 RepID=UPI0023DCAC1A|nr:uncharacterized protein LOC128951860 [Oppia nitens]XP_054153121.1 uncharacterized protein LOC128951860 [Oppia nitens]